MTICIRLAVFCCLIALVLSDGRGFNMRGGMMRRYNGPFRFSYGNRMPKRNNTKPGSDDDSDTRPQRPWGKPKNGSAEGPRRGNRFSPYGGEGSHPTRPSPPMRGSGPRIPQRRPSKPKNGSAPGQRRGPMRPTLPMKRRGPGMNQRRPAMPRWRTPASAARRAMFAFMRRRVRIQRRMTRMRALVAMFARRLSSRRRGRRDRNDDDTDEDKKKRMENFINKVKAVIENEDGDKKNKTMKRPEFGARRRGAYGAQMGRKGQYGRKGNKSKDNSEMDDGTRPEKHRGNDTDKRPGPMQGGEKRPAAGDTPNKMLRRRSREAFLRRALKILLKWKEDDDKDEEEKKSLEDLISQIQDILDEDDTDDNEQSDDEQIDEGSDGGDDDTGGSDEADDGGVESEDGTDDDKSAS